MTTWPFKMEKGNTLYVLLAVARRSWTFAKRRRDLEAENDD